MKKFFLIFILCCSVMQVQAQTTNLVFKHLTRASGLPVDEVTCLAQDSTGFIWIGSKEGLFRFDGFTYKAFSHTPGNPQTIPNNYITRIYVDADGLLWVGTSGGLALMKNNGQVIKIINSDSESLFSKEANRVHDIQENKKSYWITTGGGLFSIHKKESKITSLKKHDLKKDFNYSTNDFGPFFIDKNNQLWITTLYGLVIYNPFKRELFHTEHNPSSLKILQEKTAFRSLWMDESKRTIIYSTWEPAVRNFNIDSNEITTLYSGKNSANPQYDNLINQFLKDNHGTLWVATGNGIKTINQKNSEQLVQHQATNSYSIINNQISSLLQDKEGSIWVGTTQGISITQPYVQSFINISSNNAEKYSFGNWNVNSISAVDINSYLVGTNNGVYKTDAAFNVLKHFSFGTSDYDWVWKNYRHGDIIFISTQKGNLLYNIKTKTLTKLTELPFDTFYPISSFSSGKDSSIWMSQYRNNFLQYFPESKKYKIYKLPELGEEPAVVHLANNKDDNVWVLSTTTGILHFDIQKEQITEKLIVRKKNGLLETNILFTKNLGEELLIGYVSKGISLYHLKNKTFRHFSRSDGLISNSVTDAIQTDPETVWISTRNGISRFDLATYSFVNYGYDNGILQNDFKCITRLPDGRLAAGNKKGLVYFSPDKFHFNQKLPPPIITAINVHGKDVDIDAFSKNNSLNISYNQNYFSIEYISLQYVNNSQIEYAYKLEGFDKNWIHAGTRRFASYSNVSGGNYNLRIRSRFPGGEWIENNFALPIVVQTAFYKTTWFLVVLALAILAVIYGIFRYRLNQIIRLQKIRSSISSDLHDEVGATLSSISIFSEMAKQSVPPDSKAEPFLQRIGDRSRDSIEKMSDIIWSINPENDSFQQMLIRMKTFVNETVEGKDIAVHWKENEMVSKLKLDMTQRKNLYLLFKEGIINAVKYADAKNISVELVAYNKLVSLNIKDDGKGFCYTSIKPGNGIKNMKNRALLLKGTASVVSTPGKGTTVQVQFKP